MSVVRLAVVLSVLTFSACSTSPQRTREAQGVDPFASHAAPTGKRAFEIADFYAAAVVGAPSLAPDEMTAVFGVRRYDLTAGKTWSQIWRARLSDGTVSALTSGQHSDTDPQFTPDGRSLVFLSNRGGTSQVWTMPTRHRFGAALT